MAPFLTTLALGLWGIRRDGSMWGDETATFDAAHRSLPDLFSLVLHTEGVHGLYFLLMHGMFAAFGDSLVTLRIPSVLAMCAAAAGVAAIGQRLLGSRAGLMAGLAFPLAPAVQHYLQEGRSYALVTALVTWSTWLLLRAIDEGRVRLWICYSVLMLFACLFHEFAVLAMLAHGVTLLLARVSWATWTAWVFAALGVLIGMIPLVILSLLQARQVSWITTPGWANLYDYPQLVLLSVVGFGIVMGLSRQGEIGRPVPLWALALPMLLVPTTVLLLVSYTVMPLYVNRYVLYFVIGYALLTGAAVDRLWSLAEQSVRPVMWRSIGVVLAALLLIQLVPGWLFERTPGSREDDDAATAQAVRDMARPGDGLLFIPIRRREVTQVYPDAFQGLRDLALAQDPASSNTLYGIEWPPYLVGSELLTVRRVVVVSDTPPRGQPQDTIPQEHIKREILRTYFQQCDIRRVTGVLVTIYVRGNAC